MLYLNPPFHIIEGISIFPDHADPLQYYYLPVMPKLTTVFDPVIGQEVPQLQLLKFTGEAGSGGFLNFSVNLGVEQDALEEIRKELRRLNDLRDLPRLAPVNLEDGRVRLMILGKATPEPPPAGGAPAPTPAPQPAGLPQFVLKIDHYAKPALYGDNQAIFSVQLDPAGTTLIEDSLEGELMPIGVLYALDFLALRPAFSYRITADWSRVQTHLEDSFGASVFFLSTQIDKVVDKLIEDKVINIEIDQFIPEGEESASVIGDLEQVKNEVKDMVLENFFEPSLNPVKEEKDGWDKAADLAMRVNTLAVTGGWAGVATLSYKKIDLTRIDKKRLNVNVRERTTVRRSIYPQAHLQGLFRLLRDAVGNIDLERFVRPVNLDDDFFKRRQVRAISRADFGRDSIESINVSLRYGGEPKNVLLDPATQTGSAKWGSVLQNGRMVRPVQASYRVTFKGVDSAERPATLVSPEIPYEGDELEINPRGDGLYHILDVPITALDFPWETYPHVEVQARYIDPEHGINLQDTFLLDKDRTEVHWPLFLRDRMKDTFEYRVIYRAADNRDWLEEWKPTSDEQIILRDPRPNKRAVTIVPAVFWDVVSMIFVDVAYRDEENGVFKEESFIFDDTPEGKARRTFTVSLEDPDLRQVSYTIKFLFKDNSFVELPPSVTMGKEIIIRSDMKGHRVITVQPEAVDFADRSIDRIKVDLSYADDAAGLTFANAFTFRSPGERAHFEFDYVDSAKNRYIYQVTTVFKDGFSVTRDAVAENREVLSIPVS